MAGLSAPPGGERVCDLRRGRGRALRRNGRSIAHARVDDYAAGAVAAGASTIVGAAELMQRDVPWQAIRHSLRSPGVGSLARGLALGFPLLILFGALFAAADAVFENLLTAAVPTLPRGLLLQLALAAAIAWTSAGLLRDLRLSASSWRRRSSGCGSTSSSSG